MYSRLLNDANEYHACSGIASLLCMLPVLFGPIVDVRGSSGTG